MKKILLIESSARGSDSCSNQAARSIVNELQRRIPGAKVAVRDLAQNAPPLGEDFAGLVRPPLLARLQLPVSDARIQPATELSK